MWIDLSHLISFTEELQQCLSRRRERASSCDNSCVECVCVCLRKEEELKVLEMSSFYLAERNITLQPNIGKDPEDEKHGI